MRRRKNWFLFSVLMLFLTPLIFHTNIFNADCVKDGMWAPCARTKPPTMQWNRTYGGLGDEVAFSVVQLSNGGYVIAGHTTSFGMGGDDFWLVQTDSTGQMLWNKTYGGEGDEGAFSMVQTSDQGYALAGDVYVSAEFGWDFWLVKTDSYYTMLFEKTYGGPSDEGALSMIQAIDGGYVLAGTTKPMETEVWDVWFIKADPEGKMLWNRTYGGLGDDAAFSVIITADGGYAVAGQTSSFGSGAYDFWLIKTDSVGTMQWNKTYGGKGEDAAFSIVQTKDGGYALAGNTKSYGAGGYDFWLVRTDAKGNLLWNKTYGGMRDEGVFSMIQTSDNGFLLAGDTNSFGAGGYDYWLVKTNQDGEMVWNKTFGGLNDDAAFSVVQTTDGGYALAGDTKSYGAGNWDFWLVKLSPLAETAVPLLGGPIIKVIAALLVFGVIIFATIVWRKRKPQSRAQARNRVTLNNKKSNGEDL